MNRLLLTGTHSGCGKTTVFCALLAALKNSACAAQNSTRREYSKLTAFKCGPDYIDPMFHRATLGIPTYNIDPFFLNDAEQMMEHLMIFAGDGKGEEKNNLVLIEGAMAYYDGIANTDESSAYTVARATGTPAVLVVDVHGIGNSIYALLEGFVRHKTDSGIKGVIFNRASESRYADLARTALELNLVPCGYMPKNSAFSIESRHLGLITADEIPALKEKLSVMGRQAEETLDIDELLQIAADMTRNVLIREHEVQGGGRKSVLRIKTFGGGGAPPQQKKNKKIKIGIAKDEAFCFHYLENHEMLRSLGCELTFFSPLHDCADVLDDLHGLYLCGGYPELHAVHLQENVAMRSAVKEAVLRGVPTVAECGGFMYLHEAIDGYAMAGVIKGETRRTDKLQRFGYLTLTAAVDNLFCDKGGTIRCHEFHYQESDNPGDDWIASKAGRYVQYNCCHASQTLYAGFPHIYFPANPDFALRFVQKAKDFESALCAQD